MNNQLPKRKSIRLSQYDYSQNGAYFITICTKDRRHLLSKIHTVGAIHESPVIQLTECGKMVADVLVDVPLRFGCNIDKYVIMPNHVHLLISFDRERRAIRESPLQGRSDLSKIIGYLKMNASKQIHEKYGNIEVWQRGYYHHVVRNQVDYDDIYRYIESNPLQWEQDELYNGQPEL